MEETNLSYPASFDVDYQEEHDRFTTFVRIIWAVPVIVILSLLSGVKTDGYMHSAGKHASSTGGDIAIGLSVATALMIVFRQVYPRWWFNFALELNRFSARVGAYLFLLTDKYPSTTDKQSVHLDIAYPNVKQDLNRWLPLVKWLLAIPHFLVLLVLFIAAVFVAIIAWFAIIFTGRYPRGLFDFEVGVGRYATRVNAYAILLTTDQYPPFSLS